MVPYSEVDKSNFYTMSSKGVMQHVGIETIFTTLDKWEAEYNTYCRLVHYPTFYLFRLWKGFYVWRKAIVYTKFRKAQTHLRDNLFIVNEELRSGLLKIQQMCIKMVDSTFVENQQIQEFELFYFIEDQVIVCRDFYD